jgi:putative DNA modification/repair radical SAM protein
MHQDSLEKLKVLAGAAKYDVSCASSGTQRTNKSKGLGNATAFGICHSFAEDGRCISLLKIMLTNICIYDCAYCVNRRSNDIPRSAFTPEEVVELTISFYRRNYIEGLFLSSGVIRNPDFTMERLIRVARDLRSLHHFNGYIHLKSIPGSSVELVKEAGRWADRLSVNIEIPTEKNLKFLAPEKNYSGILNPMGLIKTGILENREDRKKFRSTKRYAPAGQSTQMIIGASPETDQQILGLSTALYTHQHLKRVYYSGFIPVNSYDSRLPALSAPPLQREHRLYQADWLMRFYQFKVDEIVNDQFPNLETAIDPKLSYALRNPHLYPVDINTAPLEIILRVPGIGPTSAKRIVTSRQYQHLTSSHLKKLGVVMKRARYFITCMELEINTVNETRPEYLRRLFAEEDKHSLPAHQPEQLSLFLP